MLFNESLFLIIIIISITVTVFRLVSGSFVVRIIENFMKNRGE